MDEEDEDRIIPPRSDQIETLNHNLDGASSDEDETAGAVPAQQPVQQPVNPLLDRHAYRTVPIANDGDPNHTLNYPFESGMDANSKSAAYYATWSVIQIILYLATPFFNALLRCTNDHYWNDPISMRDCNSSEWARLTPVGIRPETLHDP